MASFLIAGVPSLRGALGLLCTVLSLAACRGGAAVPCIGMDAPSALVTGAALFRVDVYSTEARCSDPGGPGGAALLTRSFSAGQPLTFDVSAGRRPVVLTSYADGLATVELGRACTEADLGAGRKVCLDLHLEAPPDLAGSAPDLGPLMSCDVAGPSFCGGLRCCEGACRDVSADVTYCGGCRGCAGDHVATPSCDHGLCQSSCGAGYGNCVQPAAPAPDDGCETATSSSIAHCGACDRGCATAHVQAAACASGQCTSTCQSGFVNCSKPVAPALDDGCECTGTACCPGNTCQTSHANGLGQSYLDCVAINTHDATQAGAARAAWPVVVIADFPGSACADTTPVLCRQTATTCACWGYTTGANTVGNGRVHLNGANNTCMCPLAGDPLWN